MTAHLWQLRADVAPIEAAAGRWRDVALCASHAGTTVLGAARSALEGWESAASEAYDQHRRAILAAIDELVDVAGAVEGSLRALARMVLDAQARLDTAWVQVRDVQHCLVGDDQHLVWHPCCEEEDEQVRRAELVARDIRARLAVELRAESVRLDQARTTFDLVRGELGHVAGSAWDLGATADPQAGQGGGATAVTGGGGGSSASGIVVGGPSAGAGGAPAGVGSLPPVAVHSPDLSGLALGGLGAASIAAAARMAFRRGRPALAAGAAAGAAMGGAMGGVPASTSRGGAAGRPGAPGSRAGSRTAPVKPEDPDAVRRREEEAAARKAAEAKEAKRAAIEERRKARAERRAEREAALSADAEGAGQGVPETPAPRLQVVEVSARDRGSEPAPVRR